MASAMHGGIDRLENKRRFVKVPCYT